MTLIQDMQPIQTVGMHSVLEMPFLQIDESILCVQLFEEDEEDRRVRSQVESAGTDASTR